MVVDSPRQLTRIEWGRDLVFNRNVEGLSQKLILAHLRVERTEEPKLVPLDRTADVESGIDIREFARRCSDQRKSACFDVSHEALGSQVAKDIAVKVVTAALGDNVKDTTGRSAILSTKRTGLDLNFLNEFERKISSRAAKGGVGRVHAVENVVVFRSG